MQKIDTVTVINEHGEVIGSQTEIHDVKWNRNRYYQFRNGLRVDVFGVLYCLFYELIEKMPYNINKIVLDKNEKCALADKMKISQNSVKVYLNRLEKANVILRDRNVIYVNPSYGFYGDIKEKTLKQAEFDRMSLSKRNKKARRC